MDAAMKAGILNKKTEVKRNIMNPLADVMTLIKKNRSTLYASTHSREALITISLPSLNAVLI